MNSFPLKTTIHNLYFSDLMNTKEDPYACMKLIFSAHIHLFERVLYITVARHCEQIKPPSKSI